MGNKYTLLMILFVFLVMITLIAQDMEIATSSDILILNNTETGTSSTSLISLLGVLFRVLTFQIPAIPLMINLFVFYPITVGVMAMIVDVLKDLIPFT